MERTIFPPVLKLLVRGTILRRSVPGCERKDDDEQVDVGAHSDDGESV